MNAHLPPHFLRQTLPEEAGNSRGRGVLRRCPAVGRWRPVEVATAFSGGYFGLLAWGCRFGTRLYVVLAALA